MALNFIGFLKSLLCKKKIDASDTVVRIKPLKSKSTFNKNVGNVTDQSIFATELTNNESG